MPAFFAYQDPFPVFPAPPSCYNNGNNGNNGVGMWDLQSLLYPSFPNVDDSFAPLLSRLNDGSVYFGAGQSQPFANVNYSQPYNPRQACSSHDHQNLRLSSSSSFSAASFSRDVENNWPPLVHRTAATNRRVISEPYPHESISRPASPYASTSRKSRRTRPKKADNAFFIYRRSVQAALADEDSFGIDSQPKLTAIVSRLWHSVADQEVWYEWAADPDRPKPPKELPAGVSGFDELKVEDVLEALRVQIRACVDPSLDPHLDDFRRKRKRLTKQSFGDARQYDFYRKRIFERWCAWKGETDLVLPPAFYPEDQYVTEEDLTAWLGETSPTSNEETSLSPTPALADPQSETE